MRRRNFEVYSLSAIDLFASAMGAFIIITIILMPDYQKEIRSQGDLELMEALAGKTQALLKESEQGQKNILEALRAAQTRHEDLQAEHEIVSSELETLEAEQQARHDEPPPPPPSPVVTPDKEGSNQVTFRFLGLKTDRKRILFLVDMNGEPSSGRWSHCRRATNSEFWVFSNSTPAPGFTAGRLKAAWSP
jgi:hypothetical protein